MRANWRGSFPGIAATRSSVLGVRCSCAGGFVSLYTVSSCVLRPIFDQKSRRDGAVDAELGAALAWWGDVLRLRICELRCWDKPTSSPVHLFVDASGSPPYLGAVAYDNGKVWWTHMAPPPAALDHFKARADNQIMGL